MTLPCGSRKPAMSSMGFVPRAGTVPFHPGESVAAEMPGLPAGRGHPAGGLHVHAQSEAQFQGGTCGRGGSALSTCFLSIKTAEQKPRESTSRAVRLPATCACPGASGRSAASALFGSVPGAVWTPPCVTHDAELPLLREGQSRGSSWCRAFTT